MSSGPHGPFFLKIITLAHDLILCLHVKAFKSYSPNGHTDRQTKRKTPPSRIRGR